MTHTRNHLLMTSYTLTLLLEIQNRGERLKRATIYQDAQYNHTVGTVAVTMITKKGNIKSQYLMELSI
jgi:hypothetical protein